MVVRLTFEERGTHNEPRPASPAPRPAPAESPDARSPDAGERSVTILPTSAGPPLRLSREDVDKIARAVERNGGAQRDGTHG